MRRSKPTNVAGRLDRADGGDVQGWAGNAIRPSWLGVILVLIGLGTYANSFRGVFLFDDIDAIILNNSIRSLWPITTVLNPPEQKPVAGRPILNLTFAVNYAFGGVEPGGYHAVNIAIHLAAGLLLLGIVRRILLSDRARERYGSRASTLAGLIALLWVVHPLQTESVTYIVQRAESLVGFFYLLTLYCVVRGIQQASGSGRGWFVGAVIACGLGMASKENMATAPLMALLLDRLFFSGSFRGMLRRRWALHAALAATLLILAALMAGGPRSMSAGFSTKGMTVADFAKSQPLIILHYLRLSVWPHPLCLDYYWRIVNSWPAIVFPTLVLTAAAVASLWAIRRHPGVAYLGLFFFIVLAPTSSFVPLKDLAFEHRMYLPLAAVITLLVLLVDRAGDNVLKRAPVSASAARGAKLAAAVLVAVIFAGMTIRRNMDYQSSIGMWNKVIAQRPDNARAISNLGVIYGILGRHEEAVETCRRAVTMDPNEGSAQANLGKSLAKLGRYEEAIVEYRKALALDPDDTQVMYSMALAMEVIGRLDESEKWYREVTGREPDNALAFMGLGICLQHKADFAAAAEAYRRALAADSQNIDARCNLAACLTRIGKAAEAVAECRNALKLSPRAATVWYVLGNVHSSNGQWTEALDAFRQAVANNPTYPDARCNLGVALAQLGRMDEAISTYRENLQTSPRHVNTHLNLGNLLARVGRPDEAAAEFTEVLRIEPGHAAARRALDALKAGRPLGG
jgi:tetratricopeptide (TPR) repeat protein